MASALWAASALFSVAQDGVDGVNLHSFEGLRNGLFDFTESAAGWTGDVHPIYYGALLFAHAAPAGSRLLRGYHAGLDVRPFADQQVTDAGDIPCTPFAIDEAVVQIEAGARSLMADAAIPIVLGGDHTVALPVLRAVRERHGPVALIHFDAHLDTWDTYFGAPYTHGTPFRRAHEEGLLVADRCAHLGIRGPLFTPQDLVDDAGFGFTIVGAFDYLTRSVDSIAGEIRERVGDLPAYVSIDVDVMDPAHAPGTGTPEAGGLSSRELLATLRAFEGIRIAGADVVEVAPAYDHAEITAIAAANVVYELLGLTALAAR
jgi:agmatinase